MKSFVVTAIISHKRQKLYPSPTLNYRYANSLYVKFLNIEDVENMRSLYQRYREVSTLFLKNTLLKGKNDIERKFRFWDI